MRLSLDPESLGASHPSLSAFKCSMRSLQSQLPGSLGVTLLIIALPSWVQSCRARTLCWPGYQSFTYFAFLDKYEIWNYLNHPRAGQVDPRSKLNRMCWELVSSVCTSCNSVWFKCYKHTMPSFLLKKQCMFIILKIRKQINKKSSIIPWHFNIHLCISSLPLPFFLPFLPPSLVIPSAIFSAHNNLRRNLPIWVR